MRLAHSRPALGRNPLQGSIFNPSETPQIFGDSVAPAESKIGSQYLQVEAVLADGYWRTIPNICAELRRRYPSTHFGESSVASRLRDMRLRGWKVERELARPGSRVFQYRAIRTEATR